MCGRFINLNSNKKLKNIFDINDKNNLKNINSYNVAPSQQTIIINNDNNCELADWGFKFVDKESQKENLVINSRLETINNKLIFKDSFLKRKCIIPANGYYEWHKENNIKKPYFIHVPEKETIFFAGIWKYIDFYKSKRLVFSIITKPANYILTKIHHRMPVIFSIEESKEYLESNNNEFLDTNFVSIIEKYFEFYEISKFVNSPVNNSPECINPIK
ncbi:MAG: putative SOS response-associated peptidase YedK [Alphaproteobacteria bacterium MarineAlpha5_Bin8]|nr:MAG: putative SOS response-associated peptidase YedK [Alphaproteobacteria bacterium MarineAlpha5_Bin7]PPR48303.1 MAG: putative SOS response-associated peptidase YedK [Alphaproteobacteria bacterium MarineAlpha5_Bin8]PPR53779.1 MAG: putative SOS response-associated peptidase YedK [Alphaproteobacteria bacterium MarineAlpha5_Bin6]|tara:strand:- start:1851 stop:2501 length:651 start_codon:yes stop_codon:yes gene_type:complete